MNNQLNLTVLDIKIKAPLFLILISLFFVMSGCGLSYTHFSNKVKKHIEDDKPYSFKKFNFKSRNYLLYNQYAGLLKFLQNNNEKSLVYFKHAINKYNFFEQNSKVSLTKALTFAFLSDNVIPYEGSPYEKGLVHYYSALNYLQQKDLSNASIEITAAEQNQKFTRELQEKKIIASEEKINSILAKNHLHSKDLNKMLAQSREMRAKSRNKFLNANLLYIAGIIRELSKDPNDAYVDYKQAFTLYPNNKYVLKDLYRLSLEFDPSYAGYLINTYPSLKKLSFSDYSKRKVVYLIYEQAFIPPLTNLKLSLFGVDNMILTINLPVYSNPSFKLHDVSMYLTEHQKTIATSKAQEDSNIYILAKNQLMENYPIIIARQLSKLVTQVLSQKTLQKSLGDYGGLASFGVGMAYFFESSDIKSWRLLPNSTQIAKITTKDAFNKVNISINNNKKITLPLSKLQKGQTAIIYVFNSGKKIYNKVLYIGT